MSYIAPNGNIWLLHNVPIDKSYQNTLYWQLDEQTYYLNGKEDQITFFIGADSAHPSPYLKYTFTNQYYTRHEKGSIRINELADNLLDCNYLVFQNRNFGNNKYFFAFITGVEYVNNSVTQVNFEIDVIQTWYFDFKIEPSFIERTHARRDDVGGNIVAENVDLGEYEYDKIYQDLVTGQLVTIIAVVEVTSGASQGTMYSNIFSGTSLYAYSATDTLSINQKISEYIASPDSVVAIYMCPRCLIVENQDVPNLIPVGGIKLATEHIKTGTNLLDTTIPALNPAGTFGSYTPHNKKLYTYPYTYLEVFNSFGSTVKYRYEFFSVDPVTRTRLPKFVYGGCVTQPVELTLIPVQYKDINPVQDEDLDLLMTESISLKEYPMCSWNVDAYKAWAAQNSIPMAINATGNALANTLTILGAAATGNPLLTAGAMARAVTSGARNIGDVLSRGYQASIHADNLHGQIKGSAAIGMRSHGFYFAKVIINESNARIIDSYFDRFGYAVKKIEEVYRKNRIYYTYIKTIGCTIVGGVPSEDEEKICELHDNGITYWDAKTTNLNNKQIGDYSLGSLNLPIIAN